MSKRKASYLKKKLGISEEEMAGQFGFEELIPSEEEESVDEEDMDQTYQPTAEEEKMFNKNADENDSLITGKKTRPSKRTAVSKKAQEFDIKKNVALEVSKYPNLFDVSHSTYADKKLELACWEKVSKAVGATIEEAIDYW